MKNCVILLVEDNEYDQELTMKALKMVGLQAKIVVACDGVEALDYLMGSLETGQCDLNEHPQLVLLDLKLPKLDGHEVLKQIRSNARTRLLPVVVLTSSREEEDVVKSYANGAYSYIRKPVDFDDFLDVAQKIGDYWLKVNENPPVG